MKSQLVSHEVDIAPYTSFRLGGAARFFAIVTKPEDLPSLLSFAKAEQVPIFILGSGSNIVVSDEPLDLLVIKMTIPGIKIASSDAVANKSTLIKVGAGVIWDELVDFTVKKNLAGIEALSAIPSTCGAAPIQNIGAYGAEFKDVCDSVDAYDTKTEGFVTLSNKDCQFTYRDSIFKQQKNRYIITAINLKLTPLKKGGTAAVPDYPGVKEWLETKKVLSGSTKSPQASLADIRKAITDIRWSKLPKPSELANVGSFFKNPIVNKTTLDKLLVKFPGAKYFPYKNDTFKIAAGWLIDQAGLKGFTRDSLATYDKNALVITNSGQATFAELKSFVSEITRTVNNQFGLTLEVEPIFVE